jgi:hypothetical protein
MVPVFVALVLKPVDVIVLTLIHPLVDGDGHRASTS